MSITIWPNGAWPCRVFAAESDRDAVAQDMYEAAMAAGGAK